MIELFLLKPGEMIEVPTESIVWSGTRYKAARKIDALIMKGTNYYHDVIDVRNGDTLLFKWKKKELFRGTVFNASETKGGLVSVTAYDRLQYLILNRDVYVFTKQRADQIAVRIFKDFEIPYGNIPNTGHVIKSQIHTSEAMLYDMILASLIATEKSNKKRYYLRSVKGKVHLNQVIKPTSWWVLETGVNIIDYSYNTSIEETATRVKLVAGEEKRQITAVATDAGGKKSYGVLQYFEKVTDKVNQAQLNQRAKNSLSKKKGIKKDFSLEALGIPELISNEAVKVIEKDLSIDRIYYIDADTHTFIGNSHKMNLEMIEDNDMPEGDAI